MGIRLRRGASLVVVVTVLVAPVLDAPAGAQLPVRPALSHIDEALADVEVTSPEYDRLAAAYDQARSGREASQRRAIELEQQEAVQVGVVAAAEAARSEAEVELASARDSLAAMAVSAYVGIEGAQPAAHRAAFADQAVHMDDSRVVVAEIVGQDRVERVGRARVSVNRARRAFDDAEERLGAIQATRAAVEAERDRFLEAELDLGPDVADARAQARVEGEDLTLVALDAYTSAARTTAEEDPACGLEWELLAGIGRVESRHGTFGRTRLTPAGITEDRITGIALTGGGGTALIGDSDGGELDGDLTFDRAVGPMQFIPSTWTRWARDGDDDEEADPHNLYDAALTAAAYLCASGPGLDQEAGRDRAVFSYNHSRAYVATVTAFADGYRSLNV